MKPRQHLFFSNGNSGKTVITALLCASFLITSAQADDVEVYRTQESNVTIKPNLLFVLDESSSMLSTDGDSTTRTEELRAALREIFADPASGGVENANAAFLGYSKRKYGGRRVITTGSATGFFDVDDNRATLVSRIDDIFSISGTTTAQAMRSAVQWLKSGFTDDDGTGSYDGCATTKNECVAGTGTNGDVTVTTPVTEELYCAQSVIILLTDGAPYSNQTSSNSNYNDPHPYRAAGYKYSDADVTIADSNGTSCTNPDPSGFSMSRAGCTGDIAAWAFTHDLHPNIQGTQNVVTHTIGFHTGTDERDYLVDIATRGGGNYYESDNTAGLVSAINEIVVEAQSSIDYTYTAVEIPVDTSNGVVSGEYAYLPLLKPDVTTFWKGNLKKYRVSYDETNKELDLTAQGSQDAIGVDPDDPNKRVFNDVRDYWNTGTSDGGDPLLGGAASKMTGARNLYTYLGTETALTHANNRVIQSNANITNAMLGAANTAERNGLLYLANWLETDGITNRQGEMGAPLHSKPVVVRYSGSNDLVLITTTEGVLHALDSATGNEVWSFMPDELLGNIKEARDNVDSTTPMYGLDGPMTYYEIGSSKYIVFGMRRGGRNYYALNITNRTSPQFAWEIIGGNGDFTNLGQTWSKAIFTQMKIENASVQNVLVFGGGYDEDQDDATSRTNDDMGNSIFIVNPTSGALIKEITSNDLVGGGMNNAIAADILAVDINTNGVTDRLYAADVGGRLIRIDVPDAALAQLTGSNALTGAVLADVGGADGFQRFFNMPEAAYYKRGGVRYLALMIASGHRPKPLDSSVTDRFYMIKDPNIWSAPTDGNDSGSDPDYPQASTESDLYDASANLIQVGNDSTTVDGDGNATDTGSKLYAEQQLNAKNGWFIDFTSSEKGFSKALVFSGVVLFTTFEAERSGNVSPCVASTTQGTSRAYALDMSNGSAAFNVSNGKFDADSSTAPDTADRNVLVDIPGMPPPPETYDRQDKTDIVVGIDALLSLDKRFVPLSWEECIGHNVCN